MDGHNKLVLIFVFVTLPVLLPNGVYMTAGYILNIVDLIHVLASLRMKSSNAVTLHQVGVYTLSRTGCVHKKQLPIKICISVTAAKLSDLVCEYSHNICKFYRTTDMVQQTQQFKHFHV